MRHFTHTIRQSLPFRQALAFSLVVTLTVPNSAWALRIQSSHENDIKAELEEELREDASQFAQLDTSVPQAAVTQFPALLLPTRPQVAQQAGMEEVVIRISDDGSILFREESSTVLQHPKARFLHALFLEPSKPHEVEKNHLYYV